VPLVLSAQVKPGATAADVALYQGADRQQKLIAGAKKEGTFTVYTSAQANDFNALLAAFEKKYGVKGVIWRAGSENILNRAVQEARANRNTWTSSRPTARSSSRSRVRRCCRR
jgi:iron(III) transport system substrate-binding protein